MKWFLMVTKVKDLTVEELRSIVSETVRETVGELAEDILALSSEEYLLSIEEARRDYKEGRTKYLEEVSDA
jgi:hypothetical protein